MVLQAQNGSDPLVRALTDALLTLCSGQGLRAQVVQELLRQLVAADETIKGALRPGALEVLRLHKPLVQPELRYALTGALDMLTQSSNPGACSVARWLILGQLAASDPVLADMLTPLAASQLSSLRACDADVRIDPSMDPEATVHLALVLDLTPAQFAALDQRVDEMRSGGRPDWTRERELRRLVADALSEPVVGVQAVELCL
ncbi:MAG TPA: hypothetical protein VFS21_37515 [Roseiflexaceae bacterium]|nr:hypothetical protein [Roseiflexaceae bacterium]